MGQQTVPVQSGNEECRTERRAWVRFANDGEIWCEPVGALSKEELETAWLGKIRNISSSGIGLDMSQRFEPGTELIIELAERPKVLRRLVAHVVNATPNADGRWIIGCTFDRVLSPEELEIILSE